GQWRGYEVTWMGGPDDVQLRVNVPGARTARVVDAALAEARHIVGADLDVASFYREAADDPVLAGLIPRHYGLRPTLSAQPVEMLVGAICAQQVNLAFAFTVRARLVRCFGTAVRVNGETIYTFPGPELLARARVSELRRMQFTTRKAEYIVGLARCVSDGGLD